MFLRELAVEYRYIDYPWIGEDWYFCMQLAASGIKMSAISTSLLLVRRGKNRQGLMADSTKVAFQAQRKVLEMMRKWLAEECIDEFDDLHNLLCPIRLSRKPSFRNKRLIDAAPGVSDLAGNPR